MLRGDEFAIGELSGMKPLQRCFSYCVLFIFFFLWRHFFESQCYKKRLIVGFMVMALISLNIFYYWINEIKTVVPSVFS